MTDLSIIFGLIFAAASLTIYGVYWTFVFNRREHQIVNRRLDLSKSLNNPSVVLDTLRRERGFRDMSNPILRRFSDWLTQTGVRVHRAPLILVFISLFLILILAFSLTLRLGLLSMGLALLVAAGLMILYFVRQRSKRIFAFSEQLPDAIDVIVRGVRVGLPFSSAVALVAREMPDPVGTEFGMLSDEIAFGLDVRTALENLHRRVGQDDLLFLTVAVGIQTQTGGNLGEILARLLAIDAQSGHNAIEDQSPECRRPGISVRPVGLSLHTSFCSQYFVADILRIDSIRSHHGAGHLYRIISADCGQHHHISYGQL